MSNVSRTSSDYRKGVRHGYDPEARPAERTEVLHPVRTGTHAGRQAPPVRAPAQGRGEHLPGAAGAPARGAKGHSRRRSVPGDDSRPPTRGERRTTAPAVGGDAKEPERARRPI